MRYERPIRMRVYGEWMLPDLDVKNEQEAFAAAIEREALRAIVVGRWNGFAEPAFADAEARKVVAVQERIVADQGGPEKAREAQLEQLRVTDDGVFEAIGYEDDEWHPCASIEYEGEQYWFLGEGWTWETVASDEEVDPSRPTEAQTESFKALRESLRYGLHSGSSTIEANGDHVFHLSAFLGKRSGQTLPSGEQMKVHEHVVSFRIKREGTIEVVYPDPPPTLPGDPNERHARQHVEGN